MTSFKQLRSDEDVPMALAAADLVIIADVTDGLAALVRKTAEERSLRASWIERSSFVRHTSILRDAGQVQVSPELLLLLRRQTAPSPRNAIEQFASQELQAHLWSVCALAHSPVVNRPSTASGSNDLQSYALLALLRSLPDSEAVPFVDEYFSCPSQAGERDPRFEWAPVPSGGSLDGVSWRRRPRMSTGWIYRQVVVVGERAWVRNATQGPTDRLWRSSTLVARLLNLALCVIYSRTSPGASEIALAKIESHPRDTELGDLANVVATAIVDRLVPWSS